ncbi:MAG TPA: SAM-dependent chlorinase/fluorinase [Thermoplasmata archaeon]|nr:SAM-dependent chlorinase/fluorinase [Thermoplasmata archaeon]
MARRARGPSPAPIVTLSSDVGAAYAAQMKAVLVRSVGAGRIVELAHDLPAHGVGEAAFLLRAMARGFPAGTVHLAVVDPGVGGVRRPLAIQCADGSVLVGPDNGLLWPLAVALGRPRAYALDPARVGDRGRVGTTFDGRDLFAPAAARIATGTPVRSLGRPHAPVRYELPSATRRPGRLVGSVVHLDRFGNVILTIPSDWRPRSVRSVRFSVGRRRGSATVVDHYAAIPPGRYGLLPSSFGTLEICRRESSAAHRLRARVGAPATVGWPVGRTRN